MYKSFIHSKPYKSSDTGQYTHFETVIACACPSLVLLCLLYTPSIHPKGMKWHFKQIPFRSGHKCRVSEKGESGLLLRFMRTVFLDSFGNKTLNEYTGN